MQGYNVIAVYNETLGKLLMCKRKKNLYKGLLNFVGGKIEIGEAGIQAAYRELEEETSITQKDIILYHLMDFTYYLKNCYVEAYVGKLNKQVTVSGDENELYWSEVDCDFSDITKYAGYIAHTMEHVNYSKQKLII